MACQTCAVEDPDQGCRIAVESGSEVEVSQRRNQTLLISLLTSDNACPEPVEGERSDSVAISFLTGDGVRIELTPDRVRRERG